MYKLFLAVFLALALASPAKAHPGRTDANGGHYNRSTGEYHYHHGYPEHQHTGGVCPYDFDDRTGRNSGTRSSSRSSAPVARSASEPIPEPAPEESDYILPFLAGAGVLAVLGWALLQTVKAQRGREAAVLKARQEREAAIALYGGKTALEAANAPRGIRIGPDGLPRDAAVSSAHPWGPRHTVYISRTGYAFHANPRCSRGADIQANVYSALLNRLVPCGKCNPMAPNIGWYTEYTRIRGIMRKYKIGDFNDS